MRAQLGDRLPVMSEEEKKLVLGTSDLYGMFSYTSFYTIHRGGSSDSNESSGNIERGTVNSEGKPRGPEAPTYWLAACTWGFRSLLEWINASYKMPIYITENGTTASGQEGKAPPSEEMLNETHRIDFFNEYRESMARAVKEDDVDVRSYFGWTFTDNWYFRLSHIAPCIIAG